MLIPRMSVLPYGGDYNPEQWAPETQADDVRFMHLAGMNVATVGVFSWARMQPAPDTYDFAWLDAVLENLHRNGISVILATPTAAPPAWMCRAYPDILPVNEAGQRLSYGSRRHYCPNNPTYRRFAREIAERLAERYGRHPALVLWHIDNEYGSPLCYCDNCAAAFRRWLERRYGTLEALNEALRTPFWGQIYYHWDEIIPPRITPTFHNPGQVLDYRRFLSDSFLECYLGQREIIRTHSPEIPMTTNFMGWFKDLDYARWAEHIDVISWDAYPPPNAGPWWSAAWHDVMRSLKRQPFLLMEMSPGQVNWMPCNPLQRPGSIRLRIYQTLAHGADGICYFQFRQSRGGPEQFHAAVVSHQGTDEPRVFREVAHVGREFQQLGDSFLGAATPARVAIMFSWNCWWAAEQSPQITNELSYPEEILRYYRPLWQRNIAVDMVSPTEPLDSYDLVIAPVLRITTEDIASNLRSFVERGGTAVLTFSSGLTDQYDRAQLGGYPGHLRELFGIWVEEFDPLCGGSNAASFSGSLSGNFECRRWCDIIHLEGAQALALFTSDFYAGSPAITEHRVGTGRAVYVGTAPDDTAVNALLDYLTRGIDLAPAHSSRAPIEVVERQGEKQRFLFLLNHGDGAGSIELPGPFMDQLTGDVVSGRLVVGPRDVRVLAAER